jgi:hypothetical protein
MPRPLLPLTLLALVAAGCASFRGPIDDTGPLVTIQNDGTRLLDLSYRCIENGPVHRLGSVPPASSRTFRLRPPACSTLHLLAPSPISVIDRDARAVAVFGIPRSRVLELVVSPHGALFRKPARAQGLVTGP